MPAQDKPRRMSGNRCISFSYRVFASGWKFLPDYGTIRTMDLAKGHVAAVNYLADHHGCEIINLGTGVGYSVRFLFRPHDHVRPADPGIHVIEIITVTGYADRRSR